MSGRPVSIMASAVAMPLNSSTGAYFSKPIYDGRIRIEIGLMDLWRKRLIDDFFHIRSFVEV